MHPLISKPWALLWLFLAGLMVISCLQNDVEQVDVLDIHVDSTLLSLSTVKITLLDSNDHELQVLFDDSLAALSELSRLRLATPYRGDVSIRIEGVKDGKPAYLEVRGFNLASHDLLDAQVIFHPAAGISRPPALTDLKHAAQIRAGDTLSLTASARDPDGPLAFYAWNCAGAATPEITVTLSDSAATITGTHVYPTPGEYLAILSVSDAMTIVRDTVRVSVKPASFGALPLETDAGGNAMVATDSLLTLHGKAKGGSGPVVGYAWKIGIGSNNLGSAGALGDFGPMTPGGDTTFAAPSMPGTFAAVLLGVDSAGQSDKDTAVFTVVASANANLAALRLGGAELDPVFKPATELYTASVPFGALSVNLGAATAHKAATVKVGARYLGPGDSARIDLQVGENAVEAVVLSQSGVQKRYQVTVTRRKNIETRLANLELSAGSLTPKFHPDTSEYTVAVGNEILSVTLKASPLDSAGAAMRLAPEGGDSIALAAGIPSPAQALEVGARAFLIAVKAQDGAAQRVYRVSVTRKASPNATLLSLIPSSGTLKPSFLPEVAEYFDTVAYAQAALRLQGTPANAKSKLFQAGEEVAPGIDGKAAGLPVGDTTLSIVVRAETGDTNTYRVRVHRKSNDASLKALTSSVAGLPKGFAPGVPAYADTVGAAVATLTVNPVPAHALAKAAVASPVTLKDGLNPVGITVTAEDGNTRAYAWNVYRISGSARLASLEASAGSWSALFKAGVFGYKDTVAEAVGKLSVKATPASATSKVYFQNKALTAGAWSDSVNLSEGAQTLKVTVVAESGDSSEYVLALYRTSANARFRSLSIGPGSLSPAFAPTTLVYTDTVAWDVSATTVIGTLDNDKAAIVKIGNRTVSQKSLSEKLDLRDGADTVAIVVRSEQGNETIYRLQLTRMFHPASLSGLVISKGIMDSAFGRNRLAYVDSLEYKNTSIQVTATCSYPGCTIKAGLYSISPGSPSPALQAPLGSNTLEIVVTGAGGATRTYTIKTERPRGFVKNFPSGWRYQRGVRNPDGGYSILGGIEAGSRIEDLYMIKTNFAGDSLWSKTYGTPFRDWNTNMKAAYDNGLIILGLIQSTGEMTVTRTDAAHDPLWTKVLSDTNWSVTGWDVTPTSDGGFVILAAKRSFEGYSTVLLIKLGSDGNPVWRKELDVGKFSRGAWAESIQETGDGSLVMCGTVQLDTGSAKGLLVKTNAAGELQWFKAYPNATPGTYDVLSSVSLTDDGGFVLAGGRSGGSNTGFIVRADKDGTAAWIKDFGIGSWSNFKSVKQTTDGGAIATGDCTAGPNNADIFLVKTNAAGGTDWIKTYGSSKTETSDAVLLGSDGGYVVIGTPPFTLLKVDKQGEMK